MGIYLFLCYLFKTTVRCGLLTQYDIFKSLSGLWNEARKACILLIHGDVAQARFWASPLPCR